MSGDAVEAETEALAEKTADWLIGGGAMGSCIRGLAWEHTPLGALDSWPQSLRTAVGLALSSQFPITLA